jgi:hypothetical protein
LKRAFKNSSIFESWKKEKMTDKFLASVKYYTPSYPYLSNLPISLAHVPVSNKILLNYNLTTLSVSILQFKKHAKIQNLLDKFDFFVPLLTLNLYRLRVICNLFDLEEEDGVFYCTILP